MDCGGNYNQLCPELYCSSADGLGNYTTSACFVYFEDAKNTAITRTQAYCSPISICSIISCNSTSLQITSVEDLLKARIVSYDCAVGNQTGHLKAQMLLPNNATWTEESSASLSAQPMIELLPLLFLCIFGMLILDKRL
ncbi:uncharacterized protein EV154DRAFT_570683 [Mucor mucedo]|uniref:uncharacterized protein n=1 Tax=Mucor mucedo TaxID=29922 RepID=UPI00221FF0CE|nr:uncharacterized protein EV154DRAFT_570683 [Mucor mucedo]KAI7871385.1 hypothetical protein EV154DRAFT_570683 [Mucor mucedo]